MKSEQSLVILGTQWGDEGKGKIVDWYAKDFDYIVRYSGGDNAGHTVKVGKEIFKFHLIPSGILHPEKINVLANGMVINPVTLLEEMDALNKRGYGINNLVISDYAHVIMPWHKLLDAAREESKDKKIGTTQRGIGPTYEDKAGRTYAIRIADLINEDTLREKLESVFPTKKIMLEVFGIELDLLKEDLLKEYLEYGRSLKPHVRTNTPYFLNRALDQGKRILFEGAQGTLLDVDHGTYPFVTSSNPTIGGVCTGTGIPANKIERVIGVTKAYTTRVGRGPLPTELGTEKLMEKEEKDEKLTDEDFIRANTGDEYFIGRILRKQGWEYGTTTGRPRRCGWFDAVIVKYAVMINGINALAITKLDVLSGLDEIKMCVAYEINGDETREFPSNPNELEVAKPIYKNYDGWRRMQKNEWLNIAREKRELPKEAQKYLDSITKIIGIPICLVSSGPERDATIYLKNVFAE